MNNRKFVLHMIKKRKQKKISQEAMAELLEVSVGTMSSIEQGSAEMEVDLCLKAAEILGISQSEIFIKDEDVDREKKKNRPIWILAGVVVLALVANIGVEMYQRWYDKYLKNNFMSGTVISLDENILEIKNRGTLEVEGSNIYSIRLNEELMKTCEGIKSGDVVMIHYYFELTPGKLNSSNKISEIIFIDEYR